MLRTTCSTIPIMALFLVLTIAALAFPAMAANVVTMSIARNPASSGISRRHLSGRDIITQSLGNNITGGSYMVSVQAGSPPQSMDLVIDTGSSDVWLLDSSADLCTNLTLQAYYGNGCQSTFDPTRSTSFKVVDEGGFDITYQDKSGSTGDYMTDNLGVGGVTIRDLQMGIAYNSSIPFGLMGIGYSINVAAEEVYPNIIDQMLSQGLINTKAYSLYLDDLESVTGSIIFGGMDTDKYQGSLTAIPIAPYTLRNGSEVYVDFTIALTSFSVTFDVGNTTSLTRSGFAEPVLLDSGTSISYLPEDLAADIYTTLNAVDDTSFSGNVYVDCSLRDEESLTLNYGFGDSATIRVPINELVFNLTGPFALYPGTELPPLPFSESNACGFGIQVASSGPNLLGDTFLRSAYVVYDLTNNEIALAQTNFDSTNSNIVEFTASQTSIPDVSGVASSVSVTPTVPSEVVGTSSRSRLDGTTSSASEASSVSLSSSSSASTNTVGISTSTSQGTTTEASSTSASTADVTASTSQSAASGASVSATAAETSASPSQSTTSGATSVTSLKSIWGIALALLVAGWA
ncbi:aspartic-type endopeptidase OPSB 2 [Phlyctema vagabunda]|uniref:Aspartic-type endopeptidase OPSB 2 n=1 Tax=Phlyctema vagabunda TaxID=108571 RepID=A0ABR4PA94_9HELO